MCTCGVAECGGDLTTPSGSLASPNYPGLYAAVTGSSDPPGGKHRGPGVKSDVYVLRCRVRRRPDDAQWVAGESQLPGPVRARAPLSLGDPRRPDAAGQSGVPGPGYTAATTALRQKNDLPRRQRQGIDACSVSLTSSAACVTPTTSPTHSSASIGSAATGTAARRRVTVLLRQRRRRLLERRRRRWGRVRHCRRELVLAW